MNKQLSTVVLLLGALLIALRLFFPVLQCKYDPITNQESFRTYCPIGNVAFLTFQQPRDGYNVHEFRTYTESLGLAVLFGTAYFFLRKQNSQI